MSANTVAPKPPVWLTNEFLANVLRNCHDDVALEVIEYKILPGAGKDDHFASDLFRIVVTATNGLTTSMILKTTPLDGVKKDFSTNSPMFNVEIKMYESILPRMKRLLQENCGVEQFWPKAYSTSLEPAQMILLEDLLVRGFTVPESVLPATSAKEVFSKIAEFHAVSYFLHHDQQFDFSEFSVGFFQLPNSYTENFCVQHVDLFAEEVEKWPDYEGFAGKFRKFRRYFFEKGKRETAAIAGGFNVLNHGDFHNKNLLMKDSKVILLDFQMCMWSSPAIDLIYGFYTLMNSDARQNHRNNAIELYHHRFAEVLTSLKSSKTIPSFNHLQAELDRFGFYEVTLSVAFLPFQFIDRKLIAEMFKLFGRERESGEMKRTMFANADYRAVMLTELHRFLEMGFFDVA